MKYFKLANLQYLILVVILAVGLAVRLYKIDNPVADWHSWRQADTAAMARNFYQEGFNPFLPKSDNMGIISIPVKSNPERYNLVEFPIPQTLIYLGYLINHGVDERIARLVSVLFSLGSLIFVFFITRRYFDSFTALIASTLFAILPYNIYFSRVILPEPALTFFSLGMFYFVDRWIKENTRTLFILAVIFTAAALLVKPFAIFYLAPLAYVYWKNEPMRFPVNKRYLLFALLSFTPFIAWRIWIGQHPEGVPDSGWLYNSNGIRLKPVFWNWILSERLGREILTVPGTVLFFIGLLIKPTNKQTYLFHWLIASLTAYLIIIATGNVNHDYYQTILVPVLVILVARAITMLLSNQYNFIPRLFTFPIVGLFLVMMIYLGWNEVKGFYQINNPAILEAGAKIREITPPDSIIIAQYDHDVAFLYQTDRSGFAYVERPIEELKSMYSADYYAATSIDKETNWIMRKFKVIENNSSYVLVDLNQPNPEANKVLDWEPKLLEVNNLNEKLEKIK